MPSLNITKPCTISDYYLIKMLFLLSSFRQHQISHSYLGYQTGREGISWEAHSGKEWTVSIIQNTFCYDFSMHKFIFCCSDTRPEFKVVYLPPRDARLRKPSALPLPKLRGISIGNFITQPQIEIRITRIIKIRYIEQTKLHFCFSGFQTRTTLLRPARRSRATQINEEALELAW